MTPFYDVWPRDTAPGPRIRLSVLMVLSDDGEMTLCVLWAGLIRLAMSPRLASVHIATNLSHCHDGNILSPVNYKELTRSSEKINKNHNRGWGCLMLDHWYLTFNWKDIILCYLCYVMMFLEKYKSPTFHWVSIVKCLPPSKICPMYATLYIIFIWFIHIKSIIKVDKKPGHHGPLH